MTKYEDLPSALGASVAEVTDIVKRCDFCGEIFYTIFDEADHMLSEGEESFDPYYHLSDDAAIRLGNLMRTFYDNADNAEAVRELSQEIYSLLLLAEFTPSSVASELEMMLND